MTPFAKLAGATFLLGLVAASPSAWAVEASAEEVIDLGTRRELFVDEFLIAQKTNLELKLHSTTPREIVMVRDEPWEGSGSDFARLSARMTSSGCIIWRRN